MNFSYRNGVKERESTFIVADNCQKLQLIDFRGVNLPDLHERIAQIAFFLGFLPKRFDFIKKGSHCIVFGNMRSRRTQRKEGENLLFLLEVCDFFMFDIYLASASGFNFMWRMGVGARLSSNSPIGTVFVLVFFIRSS
jgi:hypothetical protein